ncbi:hypothetical protein JCM5350_005556 [Sporobolomyces pararoseus]
MAAMASVSSSRHSRSLPLPSSLPIHTPISLPLEQQQPETPTPQSRQASNTPSKPTPLATFRLPANPHPSTPSRTAPSTPSRSSTPRIVHYTPHQLVEFEPFVASPPTYISPLPQPERARYLGVPSSSSFMSSTSSVVDSDGGFEHFERAESTLSDATYDGGYSGTYECSTSSDPFYSSTPSQSYTSEPQYGDYPQTSLGKRSWSEEEDYHQHTPSRRQEKRIRVEPITPITPSSSYTTAQPGDYSSVSRTLSYGTEYAPMPSLHRSNTYSGPVESQRPLSARSSFSQNDAMYPSEFDNAQQYGGGGGGSELTAYPHSGSSSPRTDNTPFLTCTTAQTSYFENTPCDEYPQTPALLASPLLIPQSAPIERGHFQPYPDLESTQMSLSYSLPHPPQQYHATTPRQGRTIHSKRDEFDLSSSPTTPRRGDQQTYQNFQLHSPVSPNYVNTHPAAPALVPIPNASSTPPSLSRRSSSSTSNYTPNQAALVSAASMNRLLSRFDPNSSPIKSSPTVEVPVVGRGVCAIHPRYRVPPPPPRANPNNNPNKNDKLHTCVQEGCGRKFKRLEHLKRHERTHTMEKPYGCDIPGCGRYFSRSDNLAQHRKTHDRNGKTSRAMAAAAAARENAARAAAEAAMVNHPSSSMVY